MQRKSENDQWEKCEMVDYNEYIVKTGYEFKQMWQISKPKVETAKKNIGSNDKGMCDAKPPMADEFLYPPEYSDRDWKEDFSHENGNYACICSAGCKKQFYGHKRRVLCRVCAIPKPICGENCGCQTGEDCYGEAGLNLVEKLSGAEVTEQNIEAAAEAHKKDGYKEPYNYELKDIEECKYHSFIAGANHILTKVLEQLKDNINELKLVKSERERNESNPQHEPQKIQYAIDSLTDLLTKMKDLKS